MSQESAEHAGVKENEQSTAIGSNVEDSLLASAEDFDQLRTVQLHKLCKENEQSTAIGSNVENSLLASAEDFDQLRRVQLHKLCKDAGLHVAGTKANLAARLVKLRQWQKVDLLNLRQGFCETVATGERGTPLDDAKTRVNLQCDERESKEESASLPAQIPDASLISDANLFENICTPPAVTSDCTADQTPRPKKRQKARDLEGLVSKLEVSPHHRKARKKQIDGHHKGFADPNGCPVAVDATSAGIGQGGPLPIDELACSTPEKPTPKRGGITGGRSRLPPVPALSESELRALLWASDTGRLLCKQCGSKLQRRNSRFGFFFACHGQPACGQFENAKHAAARLADREDPIRIFEEVEDEQNLRLHASGFRDCALLRAWARDIGLEFEAPRRADWQVPVPEVPKNSIIFQTSGEPVSNGPSQQLVLTPCSNNIDGCPEASIRDTAAVHIVIPDVNKLANQDHSPNNTLASETPELGAPGATGSVVENYVSSNFADVGLGLFPAPSPARAQASCEQVGFLVPFASRDSVIASLKILQAAHMDATDFQEAAGVWVDESPQPAIEFLKCLADSKWDQSMSLDPGGRPCLYVQWARNVIFHAIGDEAARAQFNINTYHALRNVLRQKRRGQCPLLEWELLGVSACVKALVGTSSTNALDWSKISRIFESVPSETVVEIPPKIPPQAEAEDEADRLLMEAFVGTPRLQALRPFQIEGVKRAIRLGGRCLLADEMGCGKTPQALATIACYRVWPVLIVCPASMRFVWAEEAERWIPELLAPHNIHIIFSSNDMLASQVHEDGSLGDIRVCIVSFTMARLLHENLRKRNWMMAIVDESHSLRLLAGRPNLGTKAVLNLLASIPRVLLLSGTPSASVYLDVFTQANMLYSGLLGKSSQEFADGYDDPVLSASNHLVPGYCRRSWQLAFLLRQAVMVRRRKADVLGELPPKQRRILRLALAVNAPEQFIKSEVGVFTDYERCGLLKTIAASSWIIDKIAECTSTGNKVVVFAHHIRVLDRLCRLAGSAGVPLFRIDGSTAPLTRQALIARFKSKEPSAPLLAIIGVTSCAVGVDLSVASLAIFAELPPDACWLAQAEDRLHRRGQKNAVDIVIMLAHAAEGRAGKARVKDCTWGKAIISRCCESDLQRWKSLQRRLAEVAALHDGPAAKTVCAGIAPSVTIGPSAEAGEENRVTEVPDLLEAPTTEAVVAAEAAALCAEVSANSDGLKFEVSPHSGRLHLCRGKIPIGWSIRADAALDLQAAGGSPSVARHAAEFRASWMALTPYQRRLLQGKPSSAASLAAAHPSGPTLNGSRIRFILRRHSSTDADEPGACGAPRCEVRVAYRLGRLSGRVLQFLQPVGPDGKDGVRRLCMECLTPVGGEAALLTEPRQGPAGEVVTHQDCGEPQSEHGLFCTGACRALFFGKRSGASLRFQLFALERGICQSCGLDCQTVWQQIISAEEGHRREAKLAELAPRIAADASLATRALKKRTDGALWEADHVVPVWDGGGQCGLENLQTLCVACHRTKTIAEATARARNREQRKQATFCRNTKKNRARAGTKKCFTGNSFFQVFVCGQWRRIWGRRSLAAAGGKRIFTSNVRKPPPEKMHFHPHVTKRTRKTRSLKDYGGDPGRGQELNARQMKVRKSCALRFPQARRISRSKRHKPGDDKRINSDSKAALNTCAVGVVQNCETSLGQPEESRTPEARGVSENVEGKQKDKPIRKKPRRSFSRGVKRHQVEMAEPCPKPKKVRKTDRKKIQSDDGSRRICRNGHDGPECVIPLSHADSFTQGKETNNSKSGRQIYAREAHGLQCKTSDGLDQGTASLCLVQIPAGVETDVQNSFEGLCRRQEGIHVSEGKCCESRLQVTSPLPTTNPNCNPNSVQTENVCTFKEKASIQQGGHDSCQLVVPRCPGKVRDDDRDKVDAKAAANSRKAWAVGFPDSRPIGDHSAPDKASSSGSVREITAVTPAVWAAGLLRKGTEGLKIATLQVVPTIPPASKSRPRSSAWRRGAFSTRSCQAETDLSP